eukprot:TCALIF_02708-PB protein Name:"Protein of unknown function" AED:0.42 eAED:1.00 QI:0/0/0/1/0/0/5/0/396
MLEISQNNLGATCLELTPLNMKAASASASMIPADSNSSNLVLSSSFFLCISTMTELRKSTWPLSSPSGISDMIHLIEIGLKGLKSALQISFLQPEFFILNIQSAKFGLMNLCLIHLRGCETCDLAIVLAKVSDNSEISCLASSTFETKTSTSSLCCSSVSLKLLLKPASLTSKSVLISMSSSVLACSSSLTKSSSSSLLAISSLIFFRSSMDFNSSSSFVASNSSSFIFRSLMASTSSSSSSSWLRLDFSKACSSSIRLTFSSFNSLSALCSAFSFTLKSFPRASNLCVISLILIFASSSASVAFALASSASLAIFAFAAFVPSMSSCNFLISFLNSSSTDALDSRTFWSSISFAVTSFAFSSKLFRYVSFSSSWTCLIWSSSAFLALISSFKEVI